MNSRLGGGVTGSLSKLLIAGLYASSASASCTFYLYSYLTCSCSSCSVFYALVKADYSYL